ncbi:MAG: hypothetical protein IKL85_03360 [Lentisphaeria bacterium]|nr:hypothetical protein [Lentisphaeria bacterium]
MKHQICRIVLAAAAVTAGVFLSACGLFLDTSDSVFDDAEDAIATDRIASDIESAEFSYEFGDEKIAMIRFQTPGKVRIDVLDDERSAVFCLNGSSGWMYVRGEVIDMTADDIAEMHAALLQAIPFHVNFQDIFTDAKLQEESEDACGEECDVISAVFRRARDIQVKFWIGKKSDLLRQFEVAREDGVLTTQYFNYRKYGNVTLPSLTFNFSPDGATRLKLISFESNIDIPAYVFRKPEKLSALEGGMK